MASSGLAQHFRGEGGFTLASLMSFCGLFYENIVRFLSLIVTKLVNLGEEIALFKAVNRSFPVNIKNSIVHRNILLVFSLIYIVVWYSGVLGVAFGLPEMRLISKYAENDDH